MRARTLRAGVSEWPLRGNLIGSQLIADTDSGADAHLRAIGVYPKESSSTNPGVSNAARFRRFPFELRMEVCSSLGNKLMFLLVGADGLEPPTFAL